MLSLSLHCCCTPQEAFFSQGSSMIVDREFFVNLAQELETGQACAGPSMEVDREVIKVTNTGTQRGAGAESSGMFAMGPSRPSCSAASRAPYVDTCKEGGKVQVLQIGKCQEEKKAIGKLERNQGGQDHLMMMKIESLNK